MPRSGCVYFRFSLCPLDNLTWMVLYVIQVYDDSIAIYSAILLKFWNILIMSFYLASQQKVWKTLAYFCHAVCPGFRVVLTWIYSCLCCSIPLTRKRIPEALSKIFQTKVLSILLIMISILTAQVASLTACFTGNFHIRTNSLYVFEHPAKNLHFEYFNGRNETMPKSPTLPSDPT